jgi:hypothetical protein
VRGWRAASVGAAPGGALAHGLGSRFPVLLAGVALLIPALSTAAIEQARADPVAGY